MALRVRCVSGYAKGSPIDSQVEIEALRPWVEKRILELTGKDDEILAGTVISYLEQQDIDNPVCPKKMQIYLSSKPSYSRFYG